ncbi:hypothetical protein D3C75_739600 [compost metagenome]
MKQSMDSEELLKEYFNTPAAVPPHLVADTLRRINNRQPIGILISAAALNIIMALFLALVLLAGPLLLFWKIVILLVFALFQMIAVILLLYRISGGSLEASTN